MEAFCGRFVRGNQELVSVKYFTAEVRNRIDNPGQREKQREYLRALATLPLVEIFLGHFLKRKASRQLAVSPANRQGGDLGFRQVWIEEEKGTDVNLASQLLVDAFRGRFDVAVLVSNDGDLKMPVEICREELEVPVVVLNPHSKRRSHALNPQGTDLGRFYRRVRPGALRAAQLPLELEDENGRIRCPSEWSLQK